MSQLMDDNNRDSIDDEEKTLFRQSLKNVKRLKPQGRVIFKKAPSKKKSQIILSDEKPIFYLSDQIDVPNVAQEEPLYFARPGISPKQLTKFKQGKLFIQARLDLHGYYLESARTELLHFLNRAYEKNYKAVLIIHGKGHGDQPLLKNKVNQWLRQLEIVLAFSSALPKHGGAGSVYVLLKTK